MDKESLLGLIRSLQKDKIDKRITPVHILEHELIQAVTSQVRYHLNELYTEGKIKVTRTINHKAVSVID